MMHMMTDKDSKAQIQTGKAAHLSLAPEDDPAMIMARNRRQRIDRARAMIEARINGDPVPEEKMVPQTNKRNARAIAHRLRHVLRRTSA